MNRSPGKALELPRRLALERFIEELGRLGDVTVEQGEILERTYSDTFDWRLFGRDLTLREDRAPSQSRLVLARLPGEAASRRISAPRPDFAHELPASAFRDALAAVTEPRMLLARAVVRTEPTLVSIADMDGQVVARMVVETHRAAPAGDGRGKLLPRRVRIEHGAGAATKTRGLLTFFQLSLNMHPPSRSLFEEAMSAAGHTPGDYSSKVSLAVDPDAPAQESLRAILRNLAASMEKNIAGCCIGRDTEFLHDFRVAVRRSRSALGQLKGILPAVKVAEYHRELRWLQEVTGPARDMDVYLLSLPGYHRDLPPLEAKGLRPLQNYLEEQGKEARTVVDGTLRSERFQAFLHSWKSFLEEETVAGTETPMAEARTADLAAARIWKVYRRVVAAGRSITADSPAEELHELRKTCKKLRYLMELFRNIFPAGRVERLIAELKKLQNNLGDFNDLEVQSAYLEEVSKNLEKEESAVPRTYIALGRLIEGLHWRSTHERDRFMGCFKRFDRAGNRKLFRRLFRSKKPRGYVAESQGGGENDGQGD